MDEVLFRLSDLPQEVQNMIIKFTFTFEYPIILTRKKSTVINCDKCSVAHDSPAPLTALASAQLLRVSRSFNKIGQAALFDNNAFFLQDTIGRCDLRQYLQKVPQFRQIQHLGMYMNTACRLGLPSLGAMKGIKSIKIVNECAVTVCISAPEMTCLRIRERVREIFVPKAIAKYWHTQDTFDLFFGVRLSLQTMLRVLDEVPEAEEAAKQPKPEYVIVDYDFLPGNNLLGLKLQPADYVVLGCLSEEL